MSALFFIYFTVYFGDPWLQAAVASAHSGEPAKARRPRSPHAMLCTFSRSICKPEAGPLVLKGWVPETWTCASLISSPMSAVGMERCIQRTAWWPFDKALGATCRVHHSFVSLTLWQTAGFLRQTVQSKQQWGCLKSRGFGPHHL